MAVTLDTPDHMPVRVTRLGLPWDAESERPWVAVCACGERGPKTSEVREAEAALATAHGVTEPAGCARCGQMTPKSGSNPFPWHRYQVAKVEGRWAYLCRDGSCRQRQRAAIASGDDPERIELVDEPPAGFMVSPDLPPHDHRVSGLLAAASNYMLARLQAPRSWEEITTSPRDQRAVLAAAASAMAASSAAEEALEVWVLASRRAGITWAELADTFEMTDGEECRRWFLETYQADPESDRWPPGYVEELTELLQPDTAPGTADRHHP